MIIVLIMVVLLTVLMLAYLLNSAADRRLSNSSLNQAIADQLAHSASDIIIGDLKEEIANPKYSTITTVGPTGATSTISTPSLATGSNNYSGMLPMTNSATASIPNLVRISVRSDPIAAPGVGSRASAASSSTPSLNNRSVSAKRWNAHFLIPLQTPGSTAIGNTVPDSTPATSANFNVPDWVFVTGSGPQVITPATMQSSGVIGRYAYAIYDEGGLLDVNVAGTPNPTTLLSAGQSANKSSLALIDLTNLLDGNSSDSTYGSSLITAAAENALVGWRNYASLQSYPTAADPGPDSVGGQFPAGFTLSANNATNFFFNFGRGSSSAYLKANYLSASSNKLTDQMFITRQQLISLQYALQQTVGFSPTALQYLTTYSRSLDQPSFAPNSSRPKTASYTGDPATVGSNSADGQDDTINPNFLAIRASSTVTAGRNDGTDITIGEPLVKKRFALNRLAWLTYEGPISDGSNVGTATTAAQVNAGNNDLQTIAGYLHDNYGLSYAFLSKGTAANIYNYFGLSWVTDNRTLPQGNGQSKWLYNHANTNAVGPFTTLPTSGSAISVLSTLSGLATPREPDFFELLKAGIVAGSKGRNATLQAGGKDINGATIALGSPDDYQNKIDSSIDFQTIQIGANILAQSRLDGYAPLILYNDGTTAPSNATNTTVPTREFAGVENLPYFYGLHMGVVQGKVPAISLPSGSSGYPQLSPTGASGKYLSYTKPGNPQNVPGITDPGFNVLLQFPVIWNSHDQNNPRCATDSTGTPLKDSLGVPLYPTSFRIVADSTDPDDINASGTGYSPEGWEQWNGLTTGKSNPGYWRTAVTTPSTPPTFIANNPWTTATIAAQADPPPTFVMTAESTAMIFTINEANTSAAQTFFREPTMLISPNVPAGSNLAQGGSSNYLNYNNQSSSSTIPPFTSYPSLKLFLAHGDLSGGGNSGGVITTDANANPALNLNPALGFFMGTFLGSWSQYYQQTNAAYWTTMPMAPTNLGANKSNPITYRMQYESMPGSGNWITYDSKFGYYNQWININYASPPAYPQPKNIDFTFCNGTWASTYPTAQSYDPRTGRFAMPTSVSGNNPPFSPGTWLGSTTWTLTTVFGWLNMANKTPYNEVMTERPDYAVGYWMNDGAGITYSSQFPQAKGWPTLPVASGAPGALPAVEFGLYSQNNPSYVPTSLKATALTTYPGPGYTGGSSSAEYYQDADGIVRRAMGAYWPQGDTGATGITGSESTGYVPGLAPGLPMATASTVNNNGYNIASAQVQSRPIILHRPFRSVAELGYVFSGTPWKNLDFFTPESGDCPLLDVFCIDDSDNPDGIVAGKVNLNTRQAPVLQTILTGAYKDEEASYTGNSNPYNPSKSTYSSGITPLLPITGATSSTEANLLAKALLARTSGSGATTPSPAWGPLVNVSDLVGRYTGINNAYGQPYDGFSADLNASLFVNSPAASAQIQRFREAPIRALSAVGQTRVWNLMIDVIAQKGRFPSTASTLDNFNVEGEQRYWVHVAIDRLTGQVIDKQIEVVQQ